MRYRVINALNRPRADSGTLRIILLPYERAISAFTTGARVFGIARAFAKPPRTLMRTASSIARPSRKCTWKSSGRRMTNRSSIPPVDEDAQQAVPDAILAPSCRVRPTSATLRFAATAVAAPCAAARRICVISQHRNAQPQSSATQFDTSDASLLSVPPKRSSKALLRCTLPLPGPSRLRRGDFSRHYFREVKILFLKNSFYPYILYTKK